MAFLGLVWLVLLVVDLTQGLSAGLHRLGVGIWVVFILDFLLELMVSPRKLVYLRRNWLTALALIVPALRVFRVFQAVRLLRLARVTRGFRLLRVVSSVNRGMAALGASLGRRRFAYVLLLTLLVIAGGAAGMYAFENEVNDPSGIHDYGTALWWTAMVITTMGSQYWPRTPEGQVLCLFLAVYAFAVFGYVAATLASFFIDQDKQAAAQPEDLSRSVQSLHAKLDRLESELRRRRAG
jgi:voltage-gated potassium channel